QVPSQSVQSTDPPLSDSIYRTSPATSFRRCSPQLRVEKILRRDQLLLECRVRSEPLQEKNAVRSGFTRARDRRRAHQCLTRSRRRRHRPPHARSCAALPAAPLTRRHRDAESGRGTAERLRGDASEARARRRLQTHRAATATPERYAASSDTSATAATGLRTVRRRTFLLHWSAASVN